ncbi:MAG: hypothetical protein ABIX01_23555 [Chitinophagaceae bacterium]
MIRFLLFVLLSWLVSPATAQKFYDLQFVRGDIKYDCLMVYYNPENCYMRVRFISGSRKRTLGHINYKSVAGITSLGEKYLCMVADTSVRTIEGDMVDVKQLEKMKFLWIQKPGDTSLGPFLANEDSGFNNRNPVLNYTQIKPDHLRGFGYLRNFFYEDEQEYADLDNLLLTMEGGLMQSSGNNHGSIKTPVLYFIMMANTLDPKIGISCKSDLDKMHLEFKTISSLMGIDFKPILLSGTSLSRPKLLAQLQRIRPDSGDIVIFSYSGHGSRWPDQEDKYPFMDLWVKPPFNTNPATAKEVKEVKQTVLNNSMSYAEVNKIILGYKAYLKIVLGDLCNSSIGVPKPIYDESYSIDKSRSFDDLILRSLRKLKMLFGETTGNIVSVAASPDEKASGNADGGYFTTSFVEALRMEVCDPKSEGSWTHIIEETLKKAANYRQKAQSRNHTGKEISGTMIESKADQAFEVQTGLKKINLKNL